MSYITQRKTRLQNQLANTQAILENLYASMTEQSASAVESYSFDSGEGSQRTTRRKLDEIQKQIAFYEAQEAHLINELSNVGLTVLTFRRKNPIC